MPGIFKKWFDENCFGLSMVKVNTGFTAITAGAAQRDPSGRPVTGTGKTMVVNKGFHRQKRITVGSFPVGRQPFCIEGQDPGGQILNVYVWQDQKTLVVGHVSEPLPFLLRCPTNPFLAVGTF
nr:hypothetical protein [Desulfotomaculum copahuensis]